MIIDTTSTEREIHDNVTRLRDLTVDQLADMLEQNTESLNKMVQRYNAALREKADLKKLIDQLTDENIALHDRLKKAEASNPIAVILKAVSEHNLQIHIERRNTWEK